LNLKLCLLSSSVLLLAACQSATVPPSSSAPVANAGRYSISQDRAPSQPLDLSQVREVIPVPLNRTMAGNRSPYTVNGRSYRVMQTEEGFQQTGLASWYGEKFHGHQTSNGEIFDMFQVSAAHTGLPIPSFLRVTNLENQRSIVVRVNDRGPFHNDRIIDLSYAAAYKLGFANQGTALVHLEAIVPSQNVILAANTATNPATTVTASSAATGDRYLQAGAFSDLRAAQRLSDRLRDLTSRPVFIRSIQAADTNQQLHRVRVGPISDPNEIERISDLMQSANLGQPYVVEE
jgi:rare lipoprotein A